MFLFYLDESGHGEPAAITMNPQEATPEESESLVDLERRYGSRLTSDEFGRMQELALEYARELASDPAKSKAFFDRCKLEPAY